MLNVKHREAVNMGVGSGGQGPYVPPYIFIHDTDIVDIGLKVQFFGLFSVAPSWKRLNSAIFRSFCYFRSFFRWLPLEIFLPTPLAVNTNF